MTNPKLQAPTPNALPTPKSQGRWQLAVGVDLEVGVGLEAGDWECVGIWDLELGI